MMERRGFELAISTVILIIIALAVLIGLILLLTKGFGWWREGTEPFGQVGSIGAVREACEIACRAENTFAFCCEQFRVDGRNVTCLDRSLGVDCTLTCVAVSCPTG